MPYSLVSAATLGFDLVRLPLGRQVADVLLTGLTADAATLEGIASAHPSAGREREERAVLAVRARRARELAAAVPHLRSAGSDRAAVLVEQLERGMIGDAAAVERVLRDDVLGPEHPAVADLDEDVVAAAADVLGDAVIGSFASDVLPPLVRRQLTGPLALATATGLVPPAEPDLGPAGVEVRAFLAAVGDQDDPARARWRRAVDEGRFERRPWATAMHEASWAAHVSGRLRVLAAAQLLAVQAFADGGFDGRDGAQGVWNAVAGVVQGLTMGDLLDSSALSVLLAPWERVTTA
ncbi:hypothetical protein [Trujillonella endophytica]|uniref:Uncharacterized protein n=1 Tax=Trujillonella endophytica TaxID=673521 RepID=A0A1H8WNC6_9ACTN|nr:hypothetical protein [Trujillella endophytica]SEP29119.1 hypothetical protein SAMN05660991_04577 [Trujillella endophytica]